MTTETIRHLRPLWFGDKVALLGHLHLPRGPSVDMAVVICATPFGYENIAGHRGLRILADRLAARGIAGLCFDFPGTGDSDGVQTVESWKASLGSAVAALRRETSCSHIGVIGVGVGGTLALSCLDDGLEVSKLVLWGTPVAGREWLRQHRAYHRITAISPVPGTAPPPEGIEELCGFPMTSELARGLTALDLNDPVPECWPDGRARPSVFCVPRASKGTKSRLEGPLVRRGFSPLTEAWDGLDQMYVEPHLSIAPEELFARMASWLAEGVAARSRYELAASEEKVARTRVGVDGEVEEIARYSKGDEGLLFSIETRPIGGDPNPVWLVLLTGRAVRHIGPNRIWVRIARELAAKGYASIRMDGRSVGDSDGSGNGLMPNEEYYQEHIYDDIEHVMNEASARGAKKFLMTGICSGATASYQVAWRRTDVCAIVMLNPLQLRHDPEDDERAEVQLARRVRFRLRRMLDPAFYMQILKGQYSLKKPLRIIYKRLTSSLSRRRAVILNERSYVYTGFHSLAAKPVEIDVFVSGGDPIAIAFLDRHFGVGFEGFRGEHLRTHLCPGADHTIRPFHAQDMFFSVLRGALARLG